MDFKVLQKKSDEKAKEYVFRNMKYNILYFNIEPGEKISENMISSSLNTSRTPVREAFSDLENNLLLDIKPQIGSFVSYINIDMTKELLFFRSTLEQAVVNEACKKTSLDNYDKLKAIIEDEKKQNSKDISKLIKLDNEFHKLIFEEMGFGRIPVIIENNTDYLTRIRILRLMANIRDGAYINEHEKILDCIKNNDQDTASNLMGSHIDNLLEDMLSLKEKYPAYFS